MNFTSEITASDITSMISIVLAIIGGLFAYYQWQRVMRLEGRNISMNQQKKIRTDKSIYLLDYGGEWYCQGFHNSRKIKHCHVFQKTRREF